MSGAAAGDHYVVISADCHGGGSMDAYRDYLDPSFREDYDAWRSSFVYPFNLVNGSPDAEDYNRNYDSSRRQAELEGDGIVGEVIFPNTIPPFFSTLAFVQ